ncbi:hypothetical protein GIY56_02450 [Paracoccus sp. YIM 132242]|uniref:Uncharacterized protein n=1 Tax=Paracoccus lichenicola TaxID=2665644 RepID=A0A6L6HIY9_9RHOB|nr:hypothetical protein [Paracoccus lichenicola]MTD99143.1 hypothetical protein [Paracoccus lichenicola]
MADILMLSLWAFVVLAVWSALSIFATGMVIAIPALLGRWNAVRLLSLLLALTVLLLWFLALIGRYPDLPLPTRRHAAPFLLPILGIWPALAARLAYIRCRALRAG